MKPKRLDVAAIASSPSQSNYSHAKMVNIQLKQLFTHYFLMSNMMDPVDKVFDKIDKTGESLPSL